MNPLQETIRRHKEGECIGVYSVCSAHSLVLEATLRRARRDGAFALIEATSNQVNQYGGYTQMQPADFRDLVYRLAAKAGLPAEQVVLGGDHLGPNSWRDLDAEEAMKRSEVLVEQYVSAGFRKIHLDCSMSCKGDPVPLTDELIAERAARLCDVSEKTWGEAGGEQPVYIVGTEVPTPGGAVGELDDLQVTSPEAAAETMLAHERAFQHRHLQPALGRVVGLVVQPGVEFDHDKVIDYQPSPAAALSRSIESSDNIVFEAHSTDYQTPENLRHLVRDHFAILKVGPALTYGLREAFWALDQIDKELNADSRADLRGAMLQAMEQNTGYWKDYYHSGGRRQKLEMQYSLSDRIRYYWPAKAVEAAVSRLFENLTSVSIPMTLIKQYLPNQYIAMRHGIIEGHPKELIIHKIDEVLNQYAEACCQKGNWAK